MAKKTNKNQKKDNLYYTNVKTSKIVFVMDAYNKATGESEKVFLNALHKNAYKLLEALAKSRYKTASIKNITFEEIGDGKKAIRDFSFGKKGDVKNYNLELKEIKFKWQSKDKETNQPKEHTAKVVLYTHRDKDKDIVQWGKSEKQIAFVEKLVNSLIDALADKRTQEVRIGIKFTEDKDGKIKTSIGYIGKVKEREKGRKNIEAEKKENGQQVQVETPDIPQQDKYDDEPEIPF